MYSGGSKTSLILVLITLAICASAEAGHLTSVLSVPETYPAVGYDGEALGFAEQQTIDSLFLASPEVIRWRAMEDRRLAWEAEEVNTKQFIHSHLGPSILDRTRVWHRVGQHPYLKQVLPEVTFYTTDGSLIDVAMYKGRCYLLPKAVNKLLFDCSIGSGGDDYGTWMRVVALVWAMEHRWDLHQRKVHRAWWDLAKGTGTFPIDTANPAVFPELTIESIEIDTSEESCERDLSSGKMLVSSGLDSLQLWFRMFSFSPVPGGTLRVFYPYVVMSPFGGDELEGPLSLLEEDGLEWETVRDCPSDPGDAASDCGYFVHCRCDTRSRRLLCVW